MRTRAIVGLLPKRSHPPTPCLVHPALQVLFPKSMVWELSQLLK